MINFFNLPEENGTLPRGPSMNSATWRALARIGYSIHISKCWGQSLPAQGVYVVFISRVVEKTALYTVLLLLEVIKILQHRWGIKGVQQAFFISDAGPHYRARTTTGGIAVPILQYLRAHNGSIDVSDDKDYGRAQAHICIGLEHHSKSSEDSFGGELDGRIKDWEESHDLKSTQDLMHCFRDGSTRKNENQPVEIFLDYMPSIRKEDWKKRFQTSVQSPSRSP